MVKTLLSAIFVLGVCVCAQAAPSATSKQAAATSPAPKYWLSDGLNRLVFWSSAAPLPQAKKKPAP